jgi:predicted transcriptional regulator YdeE
MEASVVAKEKLLLAVLKTEGSVADYGLGKDVRRAWKELQHKLEHSSSLLSNSSIGYVVYPQWNTGATDETHSLWVGVQVNSFEGLPEGVEQLAIPGRRYAAAACTGDSQHMFNLYGELRDWAGSNGYVLDTDEGAWTVEANRLQPVNPFEIPADQINAFDFDILYAIK